MTFTDTLAAQFREMARQALTGTDVRDERAVALAVGAAGYLDLEIPADFDGLDLGIAAAAEVFAGIGIAAAAPSDVEATVAAIDAVHRLSDPAELLKDLRSGSAAMTHTLDAHRPGSWLLTCSGPGEWLLRYEAIELVLSTDSPWWHRRLVRQAAYLVGLSDTAFAAAVRHSRTRVVDGRPLLARQLVAERLVRLLGEIRLGWAACREAVICLDDQEVDGVRARRAYDQASRTALLACRALIQLLGARGLTELSVGPHLYLLAHREAYRLGHRLRGNQS